MTLAAGMLSLASLTACQSSKGQNPQPLATNQVKSRAQPAKKDPARPAPFRVQPSPADVTVPAGSALRVRLDHAIATDTNRPGDRFTASLAEPVVLNGATVIPTGATVQGVVRYAASSGRLKGRAVLSLALRRIAWSGQSYRIETTSYSRTSARHRRRNWTLVGGGSGGGALIGGLAGGGLGALIGGGAGAAAGAVGAAMTGQRQVRLPAESLITFKTRQPLTIQFKNNIPKLEKEKS